MTPGARRYEKPEALARISTLGHAVIEASAGTGKTHTLEHLVLELLLVRKIPIEQILAVTFTDKAARELTARVRDKLESLLAGNWEDAPAGVPDERCWRIDEEARLLLEQALFCFDMANISTIHSFCQRVLTDHAFAHLRLFEQVQVPPLAAFSDAFRVALREDFPRDPKLAPWLELWLRDSAGGDAVQSLGKLLEDCVKAGGEIRPPLPTDLDAAAAALRAGREFRENGLPVRLDAVVASLFLPRVLERASARKKIAGEYDFDDMLQFVAETLDGPGGGDLAATLRRRYRCALIDEFQDTDVVQWRIFRKIFFESRGANPLFLIGDPKQAIYGFRGADVETYLAARDEILRSGGALVRLTKSYRSTPALTEASNVILDQETREPFFTGAIRYDAPVSAAREGFTALDAAGRPARPIVLLRPAPPAAKVRAVRLRTVLARRIAQEIRRLLDPKTPALSLSDGVPIRARDIFILTRTRDEGYEVGKHLRAAGIPHVYFKQEGLFQTDEAQEIADLLQAIAEPQDRSHRFKAWLTPFFGVALNDLEGLGDLPGTHPLMQRLFDWKALADARDYARLFAEILRESGVVRRELFLKQSERALTNYLHVFELLLEEAGRSKGSLEDLNRVLRSYIREDTFPEGQDGNVQRLESEKDAVQIMTIHKAKGLEASVVFLFGGFFAGSGGSDKVKVFHENGRRFACVAGKHLPAALKAAVEKETVEENQRLLYVALTRARARVYLPHFGPGQANINGSYAPMFRAVRRTLDQAMDGRLHDLFAIDDYRYDATDPETEEAAVPDLTAWRPPRDLLDPADRSEVFDGIRERHAGFVVTSYTGLKRRTGYEAPEDAAAEAAEEPGGEAGAAAGSEELPGGRASGIFLHALLEEVPFESLAEAAPFPRWAADSKIDVVFRRGLERFGRDAKYLEHSQRLIHTALTASIRLPGGRLLPGLSTVVRELREVQFLYPIPEKDHPRLSALLSGAPGLERFRTGRGFVSGFVDLLFEHEGLTYFLDWKSDTLPRWDPAFLAEHVGRNYRLQAKLYGLALVKMLGVHDREGYEKRFGGFLYCFLRGMRAPGTGVEGIHAERPDWNTVTGWEEELMRPEFLPHVEAGR